MIILGIIVMWTNMDKLSVIFIATDSSQLLSGLLLFSNLCNCIKYLTINGIAQHHIKCIFLKVYNCLMYKSGINRHTFWLQSNKQSHFVMRLNFQLSNVLILKLNTFRFFSAEF